MITKLYNIFAKNKLKLSIIYLLMLVVELINLAQPYVLGKSIDGLIAGNIWWIVLLSTMYIASNLFNYKNMTYDTRVYTKIYNDLVFEFLESSNHDISTKVARTDMAQQIVGVMEGYIHYYISTIVTIVGSLFFIYTTNVTVGIIISVSCVSIVLTGMVFYKKIKQGIRVWNNIEEQKLTYLQRTLNEAKGWFCRRRNINITQSTLQAKNWFLINIVKNIFLIASIIILVKTTSSITAGMVIASYTYINTFMISLLSVPVGIEMYTRISDVVKRLN
jgi:ABC-type multidrug transport system fused ATPase/permease subunit